jgi:hypothetical protein
VTLQYALVLLVVIALLGLFGAVFRGANSLDLAGPFRDRSLARAARGLAQRDILPEVVERRYWTTSDYVRDAARLKALGYAVMAESVTGPFVAYHVPGRGGGRTVRRRVPLCDVTYTRGATVR